MSKKIAKDSTDCLASGRINIPANEEKLREMKDAANSLYGAFVTLEDAINVYEVARTEYVHAQNRMREFFE